MKISIRTLLACFLAVVLLAAIAPTPARADAQADFLRIETFLKRNWQNYLAELPILDTAHPSRHLADVFSLAVSDGHLILHTRLPSTPPGPPHKVKLDDLDDWSVLTIRDGAAGDVAVEPSNFVLNWGSFDNQQADVFTIQQAAGFNLILSRRLMSASGQMILQLQMQLGNPRIGLAPFCRFSVNNQSFSGAQLAPPVNLNSQSFAELLREHPIETYQYIRPLMHRLGQDEALAPDAMLAFEVFSDQWTPDAVTTAQVNALIAKLAGGDFHSRARAEKELASLGKNAAIVLLHLDRSHLTPEQNARIEKLVSRYQPEPAPGATKLRTDPHFLLSCLYSDDPIIRKAAFAQLRLVSKLHLTFDPAADAAARDASTPALLKQLLDAKVIVSK